MKNRSRSNPTILVFLLSITIVLVGCEREKPFKINKIIIHSGAGKINNEVSGDIQNAKVYAETILNSYLETLQSLVPRGFHTGLPLLETNVSVRLVLSKRSDCFFLFYPSNRTELIVESTALPAQVVLFAGTDLTGSNLVETVRALLPRYENWPTWIAIGTAGSGSSFAGSGSTFQDLGFQGVCNSFPLPTNCFPLPKFFKIHPHSSFGIRNVAIAVNWPDAHIGKLLYESPPNTIGIFTGSKNFATTGTSAGRIGENFARSDYMNLVEKSQFFRDALADNVLKPVAEKIQMKISRSKKDPEFKYSIWQFKQDVSELKEKAKQLGASSNYPDDLVQHMKETPVADGFLLWYYPSYRWFMFQWLIVGLVVLFATIFFTSKHFKRKSVWRKLFNRVSLPIAITTVNAWVFASRPSSLPFIYWTFPGLIFIVSVGIALLRGTETHKS
jgi:hypothetical protein